MKTNTAYERPVVIRGFKYIRAKSGRLLTFFDAMAAAKRAESSLATALSRCMKLVSDSDPELTDWDLERIEWFVEEVQRYLAAVIKEIEKRRGIKTKEERIALLRNNKGRTPEEAEAFERKADELERRLQEERSNA